MNYLGVRSYSIVVVEHRPVKGVNRYAFGKFTDKAQANSVVDEIIRFFGGNIFEGSKDVYVIPTVGTVNMPTYDCGDARLDDSVPTYIKTAYDFALCKVFPDRWNATISIED